MKQIQFQGQTYNVPEWARYIARDGDNSVWVFSNEPSLKSGYQWFVNEGNAVGVVNSEHPVIACEEIK